MKRTIKSFVVFLLSLLPAVSFAQADAAETNGSPAAAQSDTTVYDRGWYVGAQGGVSFGVNTFSSFANDKTRFGWNGGLFVGYMFNDILSAELSAGFGKMTLAERACCNDRGYFLGSDWNRYKYVLPGMTGHYYNDLTSEVFLQRYGMKLNFNVLGLFNRTKDSRWRLELSPAVYAVGTSADIKTLSDETVVREDISNWHLGVGGSAQISYAITKNLNLGLFGGVTYLTGPNVMDGLPELHHDNHVIDGGIRLTWNFGARRPIKRNITAPIIIKQVVDTVYVPQQTTELPAVQDSVAEDSAAQDSVADDENDSELVIDERFPLIYFSFNRVFVARSEIYKVKKIAAFLKANPNVRVKVCGYGCKIGGEEANKRVSLMRAQDVKHRLVGMHIPESRIEVEGRGIKHDVQNNSDARIVATIEILK